jgi:hypothetical protein
MTGMLKGWTTLRAIALLAAGSIMVHELRYVAVYGSNAGEALAEQGHSYMPWAESLAFVLVTVALIRFCASLLKARSGANPEEHPPRFGSLWVGATASLVTVYTLQEGIEGAFAPGHPAGLIGVFGHGGWTALIFSLLFGAVIALLTRVAHHAIELVARSASRSQAGRSAPRFEPAIWAPPRRRLDVLALNLAGRAPPAS